MKTSIENNRAIAFFMEYETRLMAETEDTRQWFCFGSWNYEEDLKFDLSWDWIMAVVEKIESLGYWIRMDYGDVFIVDDDSNIIVENPMHEDNYTKLSLVFQVCVEFIKRYNNK